MHGFGPKVGGGRLLDTGRILGTLQYMYLFNQLYVCLFCMKLKLFYRLLSCACLYHLRREPTLMFVLCALQNKLLLFLLEET